MSLFINTCLLKKDRIISTKITTNKPRYIICNTFEDYGYSRTFEEVKYYFDLGYNPDDIFILAPSVKNKNSPVRILENQIKRKMPNVMVYVPTSDDVKLDEELLEGKIIFSTFHQTKGLERKVVIIFGFDNSYFEYFKKNTNPHMCPNELYVATTRGIDHLTLLHHHQNEYLPFIDKTNIPVYCHFEYRKIFVNPNKIFVKPNKIKYDTTITNILNFLPENIIDECFNQLEITQSGKYIINKISIPLKTSHDKTTESVSEITGIAIPSMIELKLTNKMGIFQTLIDDNFETTVMNDDTGCLIKLNNKPKLKKHNLNDINIQHVTPEELLYISNCWNTHKNGYLFKIYQITNYNWLPQKKLDECINRLTELNISINSEFEYKLTAENEVELLNRKLTGFIDCIDKENNIVYEFKCVQTLKKEHYLQLAFYMYMYELNKIKTKTNEVNETKYVLFNILTNEYMNITCNFQKLKKMVGYIIDFKYRKGTHITTKDFIKIHKNIYNLYFQHDEALIKQLETEIEPYCNVIRSNTIPTEPNEIDTLISTCITSCVIKDDTIIHENNSDLNTTVSSISNVLYPTNEPYTKWTNTQLYNKCKELGIKGMSEKPQAYLISHINNHMTVGGGEV